MEVFCEAGPSRLPYNPPPSPRSPAAAVSPSRQHQRGQLSTPCASTAGSSCNNGSSDEPQQVIYEIKESEQALYDKQFLWEGRGMDYSARRSTRLAGVEVELPIFDEHERKREALKQAKGTVTKRRKRRSAVYDWNAATARARRKRLERSKQLKSEEHTDAEKEQKHMPEHDSDSDAAEENTAAAQEGALPEETIVARQQDRPRPALSLTPLDRLDELAAGTSQLLLNFPPSASALLLEGRQGEQQPMARSTTPSTSRTHQSRTGILRLAPPMLRYSRL